MIQTGTQRNIHCLKFVYIHKKDGKEINYGIQEAGKGILK